MEPKPFAIGVRIEHPQEMINVSQYGKFHNHPRLKAADYRLTYQSKDLEQRSIFILYVSRRSCCSCSIRGKKTCYLMV